jgi:uncharacterized membrane protein
MKIENSIEIDQPPPVVFDFLMDEENLPLWLTNFIRIEHISGEPGEVGCTSKHVYNENGRVIELMEEITAVKKNQMVAAKYVGAQFDMEVIYHLKSAGENGTQLHLSSDITSKGFFMKIMTPFIKKSIQKRGIQDLVNLKNAIEELTEIE